MLHITALNAQTPFEHVTNVISLFPACDFKWHVPKEGGIRYGCAAFEGIRNRGKVLTSKLRTDKSPDHLNFPKTGQLLSSVKN